MPYADEGEVKLAESLGYTHETNTNRGSSFVNGTRHIWSIYNRRTYQTSWQTADLLDNYYGNHVDYKDLAKAIERPLENRAYAYFAIDSQELIQFDTLDFLEHLLRSEVLESVYANLRRNGRWSNNFYKVLKFTK